MKMAGFGGWKRHVGLTQDGELVNMSRKELDRVDVSPRSAPAPPDADEGSALLG
jgi:hypothetical protein